MKPLNHISFFTGFGGFDLAARWMGWQNIAQVEKDPFCQRVLSYHFKNTDRYEDIRTFPAHQYRGAADIITGGFPCQPFSHAGKRKGTEDDRYLWPPMFEGIRIIKPRWVVGENVRGLVNWNGGLVLEQIKADLESEGYQVIPAVLPACGIDAPHQRDRVWIIAFSNREGESAISFNEGTFEMAMAHSDNRLSVQQKQAIQTGGNATNHLSSVNGNGFGWSQDNEDEQAKQFKQDVPSFRNFPTQPPVCGGDDGIPDRLDSITIPRWRRESVKGFGNAIVPQVALQIYRVIEAFESLFIR